MEDVKEVLEMEEPAEEAYGKLLKMNMSLSSVLDYLENNNKTYSGLEKGEGGLKTYSAISGMLTRTLGKPLSSWKYLLFLRDQTSIID